MVGFHMWSTLYLVSFSVVSAGVYCYWSQNAASNEKPVSD